MLSIVRLMAQWVLEIGRDLLLFFLRPRIWMVLGILAVVGAISYALFSYPAVALVMREWMLKTVPKWVGAGKVLAIKIWPKIVAFLARVTFRGWVKKIVLAVIAIHLTTKLRRWIMDTQERWVEFSKHHLVTRPHRWWQRRTRREKAGIVLALLALLGSVVGLHVLGLLFFIPIAILRDVLLLVWKFVAWFASRMGAGKLVALLQFVFLPRLVRKMTPAWVRTCHPMRSLRARLVRVKWRALRRLVIYRHGFHGRANALIERVRNGKDDVNKV